MSEEEIERNEGQELLNAAWFTAVEELGRTIENNEDPRVRVEAADTLLRYFISLGQSINEPFIPTRQFGFEREDEDDEDDK